MLRTLVLMLLACSALAIAEESGEELSDSQIAKGLSELLASDDVLRTTPLEVEVDEGVARLQGQVASLYEKERAMAVAGTVRGVRAVVDRIQIAQPTRDERSLRKDIRAALRAAPATESKELTLAVEDGQVTLGGTVDSYAEKFLAERIVKTVRGVTGVINKIKIRPGKVRPDRELQTEIQRRLQADVWVDDDRIQVAVKDGVVELSGSVGSVAEKYTAEVDAFIAGVKQVDASQLQVDPDARHNARRARKHRAPSYDETVDAVKDALRYDPRVDAEQIDVDFRAGAIRLSGTVGTAAAKKAAEQDARRTRFVDRVDNQLQVRAATRAEEKEVAAAVRAALNRDVYISSPDVRVTVHDGVVRLSGSINSRTAKQRAASLAEAVPGVLSVDNQLTVDADTKPPTDLQIKYRIKNRLYWHPTVDSTTVAVLVEDGRVTLTGEVDSRLAFERASQAAHEAGAKAVHNKLMVRGSYE